LGNISEQGESFMRLTVRQLKRLIREGVEEATGGKKVYVLHRPDTHAVFAVFSNEADANEALSIMKENFIRNVHLDEASFDPSPEMIAKRAKNLAYGGG
jgi:hypothetical protein